MSAPRPDSPPPPMPSPQLVPSPLPSPPMLSRHRTLSRQPSNISATTTHSRFLGPPLVEKRIHTSRSYDAFNHNVRRRDPTVPSDVFGTPRKSPRPAYTNNNHLPSPPTTPRSLPIPISPGPTRRRSHCTSLSFAIPYRSPPPSPTIASPPPPVPPIPAFALGPTDKKPVLHPQPSPHRRTSPVPLYFPSLTSPDTVSMPSRKQMRTVVVPRAESGLTCQQFFALRTSTPRDVARTMAV